MNRTLEEGSDIADSLLPEPAAFIYRRHLARRCAPLSHPTPNVVVMSVAVQSTLDELGTPLRDVTFVVVDLETTGGSPADCGITEIGAVKIRGGAVLGEFQTLVNPGVSIAPFIALLTGITDSMLVDAPPLRSALPAFLEFAHGCVLVAHNAPFDIGFLRAGCESLDIPWPTFSVLDTARIARATLPRDEVANCKLATLAAHFHATTSPTHRALDDARATVDVLHALLERLGRLGVQSLEELSGVTRRVSSAQRNKRHLADNLPDSPGVYLFRDHSGRVLYVGKSRRVRTRVRSYFTASEQRRRMTEMIAITERVDAIACSSDLEACVRELRLIVEHRPAYNRRSKNPERVVWLKLTTDAFPRLSLVRGCRDDSDRGAAYLGPFNSRSSAELATEALLQAIPLRTCTTRISPRSPQGSACALADMGRCGAPCTGQQSTDDYAVLADLARHAITVDPRPVVEAVQQRLTQLVADERFEDAAVWRDRLSSFIRGAARFQRLASLRSLDQIVAAAPTDDRGWQIHIIRNARLVAAGTAARGADPHSLIEALLLTADQPAMPPDDGAAVEEAEMLLRWLEAPGTRLVHISGDWCSPALGAGGLVQQVVVTPTRDPEQMLGRPTTGWSTVSRPIATYRSNA